MLWEDDGPTCTHVCRLMFSKTSICPQSKGFLLCRCEEGTSRTHLPGSHVWFMFACRMATVSKDGTWKFWDTDVEYKKQQDPYLLLTGSCDVAEPCRIALSPDAHVAAISCGTNITVYNTRRGEEEERFVGVHTQHIADLAFDTSGRFLVSCGDRVIRVFHNTAGYRAVLEEMEAALRRSSSRTTKERLEQQIHSARRALAAVCGRKR